MKKVPVVDLNPYAIPGAEYPLPSDFEKIEAAGGTSQKLPWIPIYLGLVLAGLVFGISITSCVIILDQLTKCFFGMSPTGAPGGHQLLEVSGVFSLCGMAGAAFSIPLLVMLNRKSRLGFLGAFGAIAIVGTVVFLTIAIFSDPFRPLPGLNTFATMMLTYGSLIWLPSLFAATAYGLWIVYLHGRARRGF